MTANYNKMTLRKALFNSSADTSVNTTTVFSNVKNIRSMDVWEKLLLSLFIFGLIGNLLTILVMRSKRMRKTNESLFITWIAVADISLLSIKFFVNMQKMHKISIYDACIFIHFVIPQAIAWFIYWLIVVITIERLIAVTKPLQINSLLSKQRCRAIILLMIFVFSMLSSTQAVCVRYYVAAPYFCKLRPLILNKDSSDQVDLCSVYMNQVFPWIKSAFMSWIPWVLAFSFNILILIALAKAQKERKNLSVDSRQLRLDTLQSETMPLSLSMRRLSTLASHKPSAIQHRQDDAFSQQDLFPKGNKFIKTFNYLKAYQRDLKEKQITITLLTISFTFILFTAPYTIFELLRKMNAKNATVNHIYGNRNIHRFVHFLVDCLHATNFILYCLIGQRFRKELKRLFRQKIDFIYEKTKIKTKFSNFTRRPSAQKLENLKIRYSNTKESSEKLAHFE